MPTQFHPWTYFKIFPNFTEIVRTACMTGKLLLFVLCSNLTPVLAQGLRVSENRRFLVTGERTPFFWLGDTAWSLFNRLTGEGRILSTDKERTGL